ncbi:EAL domain-containing protein [Exiguobacterium qingdaonense]|uniref:EAL domain-containing protein n=1 Tax=Exiguobacterium qingdaonense TaxID=2751251 RepID=UPI001BEAAF6D|nr:EAL domain-containing protein [Exiguobacterium qingdaonense]
MGQPRFAKVPYRIYTMVLAIACLIGVLLFGLGTSFYWHEKRDEIDRTIVNLNQAADLAGVEAYVILYEAATRYEKQSSQATSFLSTPYQERALHYNERLRKDLEAGLNERERDILDQFSANLPRILEEQQFEEIPSDVMSSINRRWLYQAFELTNQSNATYELTDAIMRVQAMLMRNNDALFRDPVDEEQLTGTVDMIVDEATLIQTIIQSNATLQTKAVVDVAESSQSFANMANREASLEARYVNSTNVYEDAYGALRSIRTTSEARLQEESARYQTLATLSFLTTLSLTIGLIFLLYYTRNRYNHDLAHLKARALAIDPSLQSVEATFPKTHDFRGIEDELREIAASVHSTVHELENRSQELIRYHERWSSLFSETGLAIALMDDAYNLIERNEMFRQFFGDRNLYEINQSFTETGRRLFEQALEGVADQGTSAQFIIHLKGEHLRYLNVKLTPLKREEKMTYYLIVEDETDRVERERKVDRLVRFDLATNLYNEYGFMRKWENQEIDGAFVLIRLHDYHHLVDWYDPAYADVLMIEFARAVESRLSKYAQHLFGRYRDDTLMLYVHGFTSEDEHELIELFPTELIVNQKRQNVHIQIGATEARQGYNDSLFEAMKALQHAKETRMPSVWYNSDILAQMQLAAMIEQALPDAIRKGDLAVAYQPQVELKTGRVVGAEVLARWTHPDIGIIPPNEFIRIAERSDQILWLSHNILDQTIHQLVAWQGTAFEDISLSFNLSAHSVDSSILTKLRDSIELYPWLPDRLKIELTESSDIMSYASELERLEDIADLGYCLSIDDFGTGYASFEAIWHLPIQEVKIDRMYVSGKAKESTSFLRAVSRFANEQQLTALAEGIETDDDLSRMIHEGIELGQGFYFSPALDAASFESWVNTKGHSH